MPTTAKLQVVSGWHEPLEIDVESHNIREACPSPLNGDAAALFPRPPPELRTTGAFTQPWIGIKFRHGKMGVEFGRFPLNRRIRYNEGPPGQNDAIVAPLNAQGSDQLLWLFNGPGKLQQVLNSILDANLDPLRRYIDELLPQSPLPELTLDKLEIASLNFTYASIAKEGEKSPWRFDAVLQTTVTPHAKWKKVGWKSKLTDLRVSVGATISTLAGPDKKPTVTIHRVQCSVGKIDGGVDARICFLASLVNTVRNKDILRLLNKWIDETLPEKSLGLLEKYNLSKLPASPPKQSGLGEWMSKPSIQAKALWQLKIPGTHDSSAYIFDDKISPILHGGLENLLEIKSDNKAPPEHELLKNPYYVGSVAYRYLLERITLLGQAHHHSKTLDVQLEDGIRYLDLRLYYDQDDHDYYTQHCLRAPKLSILLAQMRKFLTQHDSSQELIFVQLSQSSFKDREISSESTAVADMIQQYLGSWLWMPFDARTVPKRRFNLHTLKDHTVSSITVGKSKVIFLNKDECIYPHSVLNVDANTLFTERATGAQPGSGLYGYWFTSPAGTEETTGYILLNAFHPTGEIKILQQVAHAENGKASIVLKDRPETTMFAMDWYTESSATRLAIDLIIESNN